MMKQIATISVRGMPRFGRGFTLSEMLVAIFIMGIGLTMAASLFPVAVKENEASTNYTVGTIICQNGLSIAKANLKTGDLPTANGDPSHDLLADVTDKLPISPVYMDRYPLSESDTDLDKVKTRRGFLILGRQNAAPATDCLLVIVSYSQAFPQADATADVKSVYMTCNVDGVDITGASENLIEGSPLIDRTTGNYATIVAVDSADAKKGTLDHPLALAQGKATDASTAAAIETSGVWPNGLSGCKLMIMSGKGVGQVGTISGVSGTKINVGGLTTAPDSTSTFIIYKVYNNAAFMEIQDRPVVTSPPLAKSPATGVLVFQTTLKN